MISQSFPQEKMQDFASTGDLVLLHIAESATVSYTPVGTGYLFNATPHQT